MAGGLVSIVKGFVDDVTDTISAKAGPLMESFTHKTGDLLADNANAIAEVDGSVKQGFDGVAGDGKGAIPTEGDPVPTVGGGDDGGGSGTPGPGDLGRPGPDGSVDPVHKDGVGPCGKVGEPVDVVTGQYVSAAVDLELPGVLPLVLRRAYASGYRGGRLLGPGWSSTLDIRVQIEADAIYFADDDCRILVYPVPKSAVSPVSPHEGEQLPLVWDREHDEIRIGHPDTGRVWHFTGIGSTRTPSAEIRPLTAISDRNGNRIVFDRDESGLPTAVRHSGGYHVRVDTAYRAAGFRLEAVELVGGAPGGDTRVRGYGYDPGGRLVELIDATGMPYVYEYDERNQITAWVDRLGYRFGYTYDAAGRVVRTEGDGGYLSGAFEYDTARSVTVYRDSLGHRTEFHYDRHGHVAKTVDPLGRATLTEYDARGRLLSRTDPLGGTTRFGRDESGLVHEILRPDGSRSSAEYNALRQPVRVTSPGGAISVFEYDARGNLTLAGDPAAGAVGYEYDERGGLILVTDPGGATTRVTVDRAGLPLSATDPLGEVWTSVRDAWGRTVSTTDPVGAVTTVEFGPEGRAAARVHPNGGRETWTYDAAGNLLRHTSEAGFETCFEYGPFRSVLARTDPNGARYEFGYDRELRLTSVINPLRADWSYEYDPAGHLTAERDFNGRRLAYRLDAAGRLVERVNGAGEAVFLTRDLLGRVIEQRAGGGSGGNGDAADRVTFDYDVDGALRSAANRDARVEFVRDGTGRVLAETVNGRTLSKTYDARGYRASRTTPSGRTSSWEYDAAGRPSRLAAGGREISFGHDAAGRESFRWLGADTALTSEWDQAGRLAARRLLKVTGPQEARTSAVLEERSWTYRADGTLLAVADPVQGRRRFALDPVGQVTAVAAATWSETYAYDAAGNLTNAEDSRTPDAETLGDREVTGTLLRRAGRTGYEYDDQGRLVRVVRRTLSGGQRVWAYAYDANDRMTTALTPDGHRWRFAYDPLGRRIAKQRCSADGTVVEETRFTWDGATLAEQEYSCPGRGELSATTWDYEPGSFTPLAQDRRTYFAHAPQQVVDQQFHAIVTDLVGTPTELVTPDGVVAWRRSAGLWGNAIPSAAGQGAADCPLRFPGQYHDSDISLDYNYRRYYDPETGRYATPDPLGLAPAPNHYGYVDNPLTWTDPLGLAPGYAGTPNPDGSETFYRSMSPEHYQVLKDTGRMPGTSETCISPTQGFSEDYQGILVKFQLKPGTRSKLESIGVRNLSDPTNTDYPDMPVVGKGWGRAEAKSVDLMLVPGPGMTA